MSMFYHLNPSLFLFMQRPLARWLLVSMLLAQVPVASAMDFADVNGSPYSDAFAYLSKENIVHGYPDGSGRPYNTINRAEALKVISLGRSDLQNRATYYTTHMPPIGLFSDVGRTDWFAPYIEAAFEKLVVTGYPDGTFRPGRAVTVEEAITLLMRAHGSDGSGGEALPSARVQNRAHEWFTQHVNAAIEKNLVGRYDSLRLGAPITRGQFFEIAYRLHSTEKSGATAFKDPPGQVANAGTAYAPTTNEPRVIQIAQAQNPGATINIGQPTVSTVNHPYASQQFFSVTIPDADIYDLTITHPADPFSSEGILAPLHDGVGHLFSYPGAGAGKIMIYGHSSGYPWDTSQYTKIFRQVNKLEAGHRIYITYDGKLYVYEVTFEEAIDANDTSRFQDAGTGEELILYTCWPPDSIKQRYLVHALPVETVALR